MVVACCCLVVQGLDSPVDLDTPIVPHGRQRRAAVLAVASELLLIEEPSCPDIRSMCSNLPAHADDLQTLECVQTFLTSQIEALSDDCQHAIWKHTTQLLDDRNVVSNHMVFFSI